MYYALFVEHVSPLGSDKIFFPWGCDLRNHTLSLANGLLASPVTFFLGPDVAYNLLFVLWTFLTGCFAALWARELGQGTVPALVAGFLAAFSPYRFAHLEHLNLFSTPWLFLSFFLCERMLTPSGKTCTWLYFTLAWLFAVFTDWYYGLFVGLYFGLRLLFYLKECKSLPLSHWLKILGLPVSVLSVCLLGYFYKPVGSQGLLVTPDPVDIPFSSFWSLDLLHWVFPLWMISLFHLPISADSEFRVHPGMVLVLLGLWAWRGRGSDEMPIHRRRFLKTVTFLFLVISLGPVLNFAGASVNIAGIPVILPSLVFNAIPMLTSMRVFARFGYIGFLGLSLLGVTRLGVWLDSRVSEKTRLGVWVVLGILFLAETQWRFPQMVEYTVPASLFVGVHGPILEIPFTPSRFSGLHLYHQTVHHQPIYVAEFSRLNRYKKRYLIRFPFLKELNDLAWGKSFSPLESQGLEEHMRENLSVLRPGKILIQSLFAGNGDAGPNREEFKRIEEYLQKSQRFLIEYETPPELQNPSPG